MKRGNIFWGLFFILGAAALIAYQFGFLANIDLRNLVFAIPLTALLIYSITRRAFFGIFAPAGILVYLFQDQIGLSNIQFWPVIIAVVCLSIGCEILFGRHKFMHIGHHSGEWSEATAETLDANEVTFDVNFGAATKYLYSQNLEKVVCHSNFAGVQIYFDNAQLSPNGAVLYLESSFCGVEVYVPRDWKVTDNVRASLGAVTMKHHQLNTGSADMHLTLAGNISLGGVEVIFV